MNKTSNILMMTLKVENSFTNLELFHSDEIEYIHLNENNKMVERKRAENFNFDSIITILLLVRWCAIFDVTESSPSQR